MKKTVLIMMALTMSLFVTAQEKTRQMEVGLAFSNLNSFGLTFKIGSKKSLWRFNALLLSGDFRKDTSDSTAAKQNNIGFGFNFGKEFRKGIGKNFELRLGVDLSFKYSQSNWDYNDKSVTYQDKTIKGYTYEPGINFVFGLNYVVNDKFVIGAEILPGFSYYTGTLTERNYYINYGNETKTNFSGFKYGLSNTSVLVSLAYRFK